jgi:hypothetical protein
MKEGDVSGTFASEEMKSAYRILVCKSEGKIALGNIGLWKDNIKMNLKRMRVWTRFKMAQDRVQGCAISGLDF